MFSYLPIATGAKGNGKRETLHSYTSTADRKPMEVNIMGSIGVREDRRNIGCHGP